MNEFRAAQLPKHRGPAAWNVILGTSAPARQLEHNITADIVIVGAGFAGLSAAYRLWQLDPSVKIAVLDAGRIAEGAAGRNSGFMIDLPHDLASEDYAGAGDDTKIIQLNRQAIEFGRKAVDEFHINPAYFDPAGKINAAPSEASVSQNVNYAKHLHSLGEDSEMLDVHTMSELTGSQYYLGGLYTKGTVMLQPAGYVRGLAAGLVERGIAIYEDSPVTGFRKSGSSWTVTTDKAKVVADKVVLTVNGHLESFGVARGRLLQLFLFAVMTPELSAEQLRRLGGHSRWGLTPSDPMGTTVRRIDTSQGGNRIVTRSAAVLRPGMEAKPNDLHRATRLMQRKFDLRFPQLAGQKMEHAWAGHLCLSNNGVSVTREIESGVFSACVQNGLGTARGTLTGIAAAEMAYGHSSPISQHFSREPQPSALPPQPFREVGGNAILRWKEWRARAE